MPKNLTKPASATIIAEPTLTSLQNLTKKDLQACEKLLRKRFKSDVALIPDIALHLANRGGKRLRAMLCLAGAKICNGRAPLGLAAAVEMIHSATLLHDDVVDDSQHRRGAASANQLWGTSAPILVGDYLFARAFELMVESDNLAILDLLARASRKIAEGEVLQLSLLGKITVKEQDCLKIITAKTAILFEAACLSGAMSAGANPKESKALANFGLHFGRAFQIEDDILDYMPNRLSKKAGDDFREGKVTLPVSMAIANKGRAVKKQITNIWQDRENKENFITICELLENEGAIAMAKALAKKESEAAIEELAIFANNPAKQALIDMVAFCLKRES